MRITPLDVRKQEFRKAVRGFDCDEVKAFLTTLADEYEAVLVDNKQIRERVMAQEEKITEYKAMERTLRDTLMTAERLMQETRENANREGDLIIQEAQINARKILEECRLRTEELRREIMGLRKEKETYLGRFKGLAEAQIQFIESHQHDFEDLDKRLVDLVDSVVAGATEQIDSKNQPESPATIPPTSTDLEASVESTIDSTVEAVRSVTEQDDVWRNYNAGHASTEAESVSEPVIEVEEPQTIENTEAVEAIQDADASPAASISAATVDMAAMGIPIPAVENVEDTTRESVPV